MRLRASRLLSGSTVGFILRHEFSDHLTSAADPPELCSEKRLIAVRANSAAHASAAMLVVSICCQSRTRDFEFADGFKKPPAPFVGKHHFSYLLSRINDKRIRDTNFHLVFNQGAIRQSLDHMVGVYLSASRWLA